MRQENAPGSVPIVLGFGIGRPSENYLAMLSRYADGAVVGTAFIRALEQGDRAANLYASS